MADLTVEQAISILEKAEEQRLKKNAALKEWREKNRAKYNAYIKQWRAERAAVVEAARKIVAEAAK